MFKANHLLVQVRDNKVCDVFRQVFEDHYAALLAYCNSYVKNEDVAKDLVQDSFKSLWEKRSSWDSKYNFKFILFSIVRNKAINYLKHQKVQLKYVNEFNRDLLQVDLNLRAIEFDSCDILIAKETHLNIESAIDELPQRCKQVLELSRNKEMKNKEIADELSISIKTVESQMTKALKHLRNRLLRDS